MSMFKLFKLNNWSKKSCVNLPTSADRTMQDKKIKSIIEIDDIATFNFHQSTHRPCKREAFPWYVKLCLI